MMWLQLVLGLVLVHPLLGAVFVHQSYVTDASCRIHFRHSDDDGKFWLIVFGMILWPFLVPWK